MPNHLSIEQRWRIIVLHFDNNLPLREIARRGRRVIIRGPVRRQFRQILSRYPTATSSSISTRLQSRTGIIVSACTIRRVRRRENYHPVHARTHWEINEIQAARRYQYAITHEADNWQHVIFTDEKQFFIDEAGTVFWIPIGARRPKTFANQIKYHVNVFGAIWYHGKSRLVFIKGSSNSTTYLHHVQLAIGNYLQVLRRYALIHDRTTWSHTDLVHNWLIENDIECLDDYPSVSPELNAIEPVWGWMKHFIESRRPKTQKQLENLVLKAWQQIPISIIQRYIDHIRVIVHQIIVADGWDIDD
ncbi:unnamed protein product [Rotaria sordida]|uniref:Tc1-like transposase DDE domain-containing protein n=1 Tax=Rotaria sordida TaxID=392033 RepID=A0A819YRH8_9BILA|nr:unnamed protein product [Rotaria sordida]CAF4161987.1 unnamed protein product [Rotaria sordida]